MTYLLIVIAFAFFGAYIYIDNKVDIPSYSQKFNIPKVEVLTEEEVASEKLKMLPAIKKDVNIIEQEEDTKTVSVFTEAEALSKISANSDTTANQNFVPVQPSSMFVTYENGESATLPTTENDELKPYLSANANYSVISPKQTHDTLYKSITGSVFAVETDRIILSKSDDGSYFFIDRKGDFKVYLNGKRILLDSVTIGDKILFEGQTKSQNTGISGTITVTGYSQLLTI